MNIPLARELSRRIAENAEQTRRKYVAEEAARDADEITELRQKLAAAEIVRDAAYKEAELAREKKAELQKLIDCANQYVPQLMKMANQLRKTGVSVADLLAMPDKLSAANAEVERMRDNLQTAIDDGNRSREIIYAMVAELNPLTGEHNIDAAKRVATELSALHTVALDLAHELSAVVQHATATAKCSCYGGVECQVCQSYNRQTAILDRHRALLSEPETKTT